MKKNEKLNNKINYDDTLFVEVEDKNISPIIKSIIGVILIFFICLILYIYNISPINKKNTEIKGIYFESSMTSKDLYKILKRENLVRNEFFYKLFCKLNNVTKLQKGYYELNQSMSLKEMIQKIQKGEVSKSDIQLRFIEGIRLKDIVDLVDQKTKVKADEFNAVLNDKEYLKSLCNKYWFLDEKEILKDGLRHPLEGYLFPDTYKFDKNLITPKQIIELMLAETNDILTENKEKIEKMEYTPHEILTLASILEKETLPGSDRNKVAGLFIRRLKENMSLGSDPTTHYEVDTPLSQPLTKTDLATEGKYNTRAKNMEGKLPIGPISSPSKSSIEAVINYDDTGAIFFVSDKNGKLYFTKTNEEHEEIIHELKDKGLWFTYEN